MAEAKKTDKPAGPAPNLARASESGDAAVHNLLAERAIHESNQDDGKVADVDKRLAELGYTVR